MKLSTKGRYGVRAMVDLAINYGSEPVSIKSIAERQNISEYYLEQLFSSLRKADLIKSIRGAQGGYILTREPRDISIAEIMEVLEGPLDLSECVLEGSCSNMDSCSTRLLWVKIKESVEQVTKSTTLQDLVDDYDKLRASTRKE
ncbi:Rrf2 family protein [Clostridium tetanomorphum]|uniref:Rrf2 family transcriptional regulator n=1 Tax=Clostridium tetanomorphum TaxID=1553 RepID=A0A923E735_CLOTT|nr:Rrf2 family transcriptional regulator [Clostridium tetanomorphum]KAJ52806.1 RRF2 family protein [Clostridium tetanomorphum DSM 665]MBC2396442.1 Rrf2 family transcriptional regulator [Clostridium tetanomorphum]MBP1865391.1 Rrf2 family protein [Clostridium tetanomorphum]NRS84842.1 Rrf2 family protein [Clostridium tetanomorphum]NRZ98060.1 Rrf2 family protein [Clostridium tetanomorphum]